eukprot:CAMPEP_0204351166 /NCGR_PEP_ID=MMETSP0469-20131031/30908_1 /ASSEMBLY_ACC=CAM_ASM_000384 /TAXON_ID=2969 /ORGANISM="Oxyrrhis marina" /LENGTH=46 /DNA_ID= /DNA_START= /DNA_END= /DNA_ORIENTATION=
MVRPPRDTGLFIIHDPQLLGHVRESPRSVPEAHVLHPGCGHKLGQP